MNIDNWVEWLQARIPELKKSHNEVWVRQALKAQTETKDTQQKIVHNHD